MPPSIYDYVLSEASKFETEEIQVGENMFWNFRTHVQMIFHLTLGYFYTGKNNWLRALRNIMEPILALCHWTEDIEVKDVVFFIEEKDGKVLSFLLKKYHDEVYTRDHDLDTLFDEITESDLDYGGAVLQKGVEMPEVLPLQSIAFCDQTDILGGPIGFKHYFSPEKLRGMAKYGWGEEKNGANVSLEELCPLANNEKLTLQTLNKAANATTGKNIEVYIVRGNLPDAYLSDNDDMEYYCNQVQIIAYYVTKASKKQGVTLYRKKEAEGNLKFHTSKKVYQRALGRGVGEAILHPQIWTNFLEIHKMKMLESASKVPLYTDDPTYTQKNKIQDMENLEVTTIEDGKRIFQVPTAAPANIQLYSNDINSWYEHAQFLGAAFDPIMGKEPVSGTTFRGQERTVAQGRGLHDQRRGKRAKFIEEIYRDWILPDMIKEINKGSKFLATLDTQELTWVAEQLAINKANDKILNLALEKGQVLTSDQQDKLTQTFKDQILKTGNKHLFETLRGEFNDRKINIGINVANKQKDLVQLSDKLLSIFQFIFANPQGFQSAMQIPALASSFENLLEFGGLSIADFSSLLQAPKVQPAQTPPQTFNPTSEVPPPPTPTPQLALK